LRIPLSLEPHAIEFPYTFSYSEVFADILKLPKVQASERSGMLLSRGYYIYPHQMDQLTSVLKYKPESVFGNSVFLRNRFIENQVFRVFCE
jgi:hypothetical protein